MTGEDIVGLHGVHISQTIWRGEWLAKAIDIESDASPHLACASPRSSLPDDLGNPTRCTEFS